MTVFEKMAAFEIYGNHKILINKFNKIYVIW